MVSEAYGHQAAGSNKIAGDSPWGTVMIAAELKRLAITPFRMSGRQAFVLLILSTIFVGALYMRLSVTLGYGLPLGRDGPYHFFHVRYLLNHYPSDPFLQAPPVFFHFATGVCTLFSAFGASLLTSFNIVTALASGLVSLTTFMMVRRLMKNDATALVAAFFSTFIPASFRMMGELQKNAFGVTLAPFFILFLWRGLEGERKLDFIIAGIALGVVGLTHELVFGTLVIAYLCYLAFLSAYHRRIPWRELKAAIIIMIPAAIICGHFYIGKLGAIGGMTGERLGPNHLMDLTIYRFYDEYLGQLLLVFAVFGAGVAVYRREPQDFFLLAWGMSALIMAQPWVVHDYQWRFALMLATPMALLAAVGLIEGIGGLLWRAGKNLQALFGKGRSGAHKAITMAERIVFLCLLLFVVIQQARVSQTYAWTGEMLQPMIGMEEYEALQEFHKQVGDAYVFGASERYLYWADVVGLKGAIQSSEVWGLSWGLYPPPPEISEFEHAIRFAGEWYWKQQQVGSEIYALTSIHEEETRMLGNEELFKLIFDQSGLRVYGLSENFTPPPPQQRLFGVHALAELRLQPPPKGAQEEAPFVLKILLVPVYVTSGAARFIVGVPLTVLLWVFLPCLAWEAIRRIISGEKLEKLRRGIIIGGVVVLTLAAVSIVKGPEGRSMELGPSEVSLPAGFEFVEEGKNNWILESAQMEGGALDPSWFRFNYLVEGPLLRCGRLFIHIW
jgi:hypothetical protein